MACRTSRSRIAAIATNIASWSMAGFGGLKTFEAACLIYAHFLKGEWVGCIWQELVFFAGTGMFPLWVAVLVIRKRVRCDSWLFSIALAVIFYWELSWRLDYLISFTTGIGPELSAAVYNGIVYGGPVLPSLLLCLVVRRLLRWGLRVADTSDVHCVTSLKTGL